MVGTDVELSGTITAKTGTVGPFNIGERELSTTNMKLGNASISFNDGLISAGFGINSAIAVLGRNVPIWTENRDPGAGSGDVCTAAIFKATGSTDPRNNIALSLVGCISGFSLKVGIYGAGAKIDTGDNYVLATGSTIYLPNPRSVGHCIFIKNRSGGRITVYGNGHSIYTNAPINAMNINSNGETFMYVFDGTYWNAAKFEL